MRKKVRIMHVRWCDVLHQPGPRLFRQLCPHTEGDFTQLLRLAVSEPDHCAMNLLLQHWVESSTPSKFNSEFSSQPCTTVAKASSSCCQHDHKLSPGWAISGGSCSSRLDSPSVLLSNAMLAVEIGQATFNLTSGNAAIADM